MLTGRCDFGCEFGGIPPLSPKPRRRYDQGMRAGVSLSLLGALVILSSCELAPSLIEAEALSIDEFRVEPEAIRKGELATVHWSVRGAIQVEVVPDLGIVTRAGSIQLLPSATTTYQLRATGSAGEVTRSAIVIVETPQDLPRPLRPRRGRLIPVSGVEAGAGSVDQPIAHRKAHQFPNAVQTELFHDSGAMPVHRIDTEIERGGDLFVGFAFGDGL